MKAVVAMEHSAELVKAVHQLKIDRDTWQAVALQYKAAFETQTARLQELQNICFATQAELENERAQYRRLHPGLDGAPHDRPPTVDSTDNSIDSHCFGTAMVLSPKRIERGWKFRPSSDEGNPVFQRVQHFAFQRNYGTALVEVERSLRGPLSPKARAEGLLLKSKILQATGPDSLYDALAACSEALELCDRLSELQFLLPKIQYQRGLCYYQLRMLHQARDAFRAVSEDNRLFERANDHRQSCDDELELLHLPNRRSAFDESRVATDGFLAQLDVGSSHVGDSHAHRVALTDKPGRVDFGVQVLSSGTALPRKQNECRIHIDGSPPTLMKSDSNETACYAVPTTFTWLLMSL